MNSSDNEKIQLTRGDWNELVGMVKQLVDVICGNERMNEKGMKKEHDEIYEWYQEQKWWNKKTVSVISMLGGLLGILGMLVSLILNFKQL
jgi:hypothetical protein